MAADHDVVDHVQPPAAAPGQVEGRSTGQLVGDALGEVQTIVRKEIELAKHELTDAVSVRLQAAAAAAVGGLVALIGLGCALTAIAYGLATVMPLWAAWAIVAAVLFAVAGIALGIARSRATAVPLQPEKTRRSIEENAQWARTQLQR